MVLSAVLTDGLAAVEAACAEPSPTASNPPTPVLNILSRRRDPDPVATILTPDALRLRHVPIANCARYDAARLDTLHQKTIRTIDRLQGEIDAQKSRIANHWQNVRALGPADRGRVMAEQASAAIRDIRQNARPELDGILREAGASHGPLVGQRPYWASRAVVLNRQGLGTSQRTALEETAGRARVVGLAGLAQLAIGTGDLVLAAVVVKNDRRRESERAFSTAELLSLMPGLDDFEKAKQYFLIGENRMNSIALAIRTWQLSLPAPVSTLSLAFSKLGEDGAIVEELTEIAEAKGNAQD